jgi:hypothetical protein
VINSRVFVEHLFDYNTVYAVQLELTLADGRRLLKTVRTELGRAVAGLEYVTDAETAMVCGVIEAWANEQERLWSDEAVGL